MHNIYIKQYIKKKKKKKRSKSRSTNERCRLNIGVNGRRKSSDWSLCHTNTCLTTFVRIISLILAGQRSSPHTQCIDPIVAWPLQMVHCIRQIQSGTNLWCRWNDALNINVPCISIIENKRLIVLWIYDPNINDLIHWLVVIFVILTTG